ncbi:hypothetical protein SAMN06272721_102461 [Arthrobacter sp. P2b]|nr:hypothetical protein SAMN06272721_102461 [Arthrobacter sp. P2b]
MNTGLHVIFGTGAIGLATLDALRRRGRTVRMINRSGIAQVPNDVEVVAGDAADPVFAARAARGAAIVYQTMNPPYHQWNARFPALQAGVLAAAEATGARLVSMENVYMYGRPAGRPLTEDRPNNAHTKKGRLRADMADELLGAHQAGRVEVTIGRASDYFGPRSGHNRTSVTGSSPQPWPGKPAPSWVTGTNPTRIPTLRTSVKASPSWANTRTHPAKSGTCPTTPKPAAPRNWSIPSTVRPDSHAPGSAPSRRSSCTPWPLPTRSFGNCSKCSTSSKNPSSSTAAKSPQGSVPQPLPWTRPSQKHSSATPTPAIPIRKEHDHETQQHQVNGGHNSGRHRRHRRHR